jgi:cytochrome c5
MLKQILLSLLFLPSIVACDKQQPATPTVPAAPAALQSSAPTSTPMLQSAAPSPAPTPPPAGPTSTPAPTKKAAPTAPAEAVAGGGNLAKGEAVYKQSCSVCHVAGVAGAPKLSDKADWQPRIAQGKAVLYGHAIKGFTGSKGMMPPKGGNTSLSDEDVMAAVDYMAAQAK